MCDLCSNDKETRERAMAREKYLADRLEEVALTYRELGMGHIKPHSREFTRIKPVAMTVIRELVDDWV